jgi:hypothetical protein
MKHITFIRFLDPPEGGWLAGWLGWLARLLQKAKKHKSITLIRVFCFLEQKKHEKHYFYKGFLPFRTTKA